MHAWKRLWQAQKWHKNYAKKPDRSPVTFVGTMRKIHAVLFSKIADVHGGNVHDVLTWKVVYFRKEIPFFIAWHQRRIEGARVTISRAPNHCAEHKSQKCHKHFFQSNTFASERCQVWTWGRHTCFLLQTPSNLVTTLHITIVLPKCRNLFTNIPTHQWQTINHKLFKINAVAYPSHLTTKKLLKLEKKVYCLQNKHKSSSPKNVWGTRRDKWNNYAGTLLWKMFIGSQGH